jgi:hypothetical protein
MKKLALFAAAILFTAAPLVSAAEKTWTGTLGDDKCAMKHDKASDADAECVKKCVTGGAKYVFMSEGKTYKIANQDFKDLKAHGGHKVALTGEMKDDTITVSKIVMPKADAK